MKKSTAKAELRRMGLQRARASLIQKKERTGVSVWRVRRGSARYVLKLFSLPESRREIENYRILGAIGVPTLRVLGQSERALLLEDMKSVACPWRLGTEEDLQSPVVARQLAAWYRALHGNGQPAARAQSLYAETDCITRENIRFMQTKTETADAPVWGLIEAHLAQIQAAVAALPRTLTYNDFDVPNLAVAKDGTAALVYDYDNLGCGYAYADIRNVCYCLGEEAKAVFLAAYGDFSSAEAMIDRLADPLTTLFHACNRWNFPSWAQDPLEQIKNGALEQAVTAFLASISWKAEQT
ncbi:MAG: aminoglycoside phosphotransferase family protein [Oscillospiraceae bacterium]|jgi:aminoglycoside phosphotransferase (APT) family kinase protein|nr:aminoglycoside phosphotransferase family protein [Oscillospiraceae bacterium]